MANLVDEFQRSWLTSLIGIALFCFGVWLLTWNEGRAVHHSHSLDETYNSAVTVNPHERFGYDYNGRVVHISDSLFVDEPLTDVDYGISIQAVKMKRRVQMYQWVEERTARNEDENGEAQYSINDYYYVTEWRDKLVDSSSFYVRHGHENPRDIPLKTVSHVAPQVRLGQLSVGDEIKEKFDDWVEITSDERPERTDVKLHMGIYYHCDDIWNPEVGDIRVQFYYAGATGEPVTIVAKQENGVLVPYETSRGHKIALLRYGNLNINQMFTAEHYDSKLETWKLRGLGIFVLYASSVCLAKLHKILFQQVPILNDVLSGDPTSSNTIIFSFSLSLMVIATAWVFYRPMLGAGLIFAAISPLLYCTMGVYNPI
ncbi:unnamed protein product [Phaedon cochleariae]|uniref:Transmembrane protein 43 homolog n=1 Tax=Phaedon cochleariae TaxID=80249 RepID=A0A9N9SJJ9_PHACE|nr:unnamed protein product [Phaedon cochleariae]